MTRVKLSEYRAKKNLFKALGLEYGGIEIDTINQDYQTLITQLEDITYAIKVDQAIKKRNNLGLVKLNRHKSNLVDDVNELKLKGFRYLLIEPMVEHPSNSERYFAMLLKDSGIEIQYSKKGGVSIESHVDSILTYYFDLDERDFPTIDKIAPEIIKSLFDLFVGSNMVYLEINPFTIEDKLVIPLDAAVEVDSAATSISRAYWNKDDFRFISEEKTNSELIVDALQAKSASSLSLRVLNPNGSLFLLLSGGGASVVIADEISSYGLTNEIVNYGEYSGNPSEDEVYNYTLAVLDLINESRAKNKSLIIAGGIANFTDIEVSFRGVIRALKVRSKYLSENHVSVYVRRGGPNQKKGLDLMNDFLEVIKLKHIVKGPEVSIGEFVLLATEGKRL